MAEQDRIDVIFGAQIAGLVAGVAEAKATIEGLRAPVDNFISSLSGVAEAIGVAFATEKIREFATEMAEMGERALNSAYILGQSVHDYEQLRGALTLVGADADTSQRTIERLALAVQRVAEGNKTATAAFHNLGISTEEVISRGNNLTGLLSLLIERYQQLDPSLRNIGVLHEILGRGVDRLAGALRAGAEGWQEALERAREYADVSARIDPLAAQTAEGINALSLDIQTLSKEGFGVLKPAIDGVVEGLDNFVQTLTRALQPIGNAEREMSALEVAFRVVIKTVADVISMLHVFADTLAAMEVYANEFGMVLHEVFVGIFNEIKALISGGDIEAAYDRMMGRIEAITVSRGNQIVAQWADIVARISSIMSPDVTLPEVGVTTAPPRGGRALGTEGGRGGRGKDTTKAEYEAFAAEMRLEIAEADKDWAQISAIYDKWAAHAKEVFGAQSKEYREVLLDMVRAHQQHIQRIFSQEEQAYSATRSIDASYLKEFEANMEEMVKKHQISKQQMYGFDLQYAAQQHDVQRRMLEDMIQDDQFTKDQKTKLYQQLLELDASYAAKAAQLNEKAIPKYDTSLFTGAATGAIGGLMRGQPIGQTFAKEGEQMMQKVMDNLATKLIDRMIQDLLQQLASDVANTGILAWLLSAILVKPSVAGFSAQFGGIVPSAQGGWVVPSFQDGGTLTNLHSGEMVLPRDLSEGVQSAIRGGGGLGGGVNLTVNAWDTQTGAQALARNSQSVASAMRSGWMQGGTSVRAMSSGGRYP